MLKLNTSALVRFVLAALVLTLAGCGGGGGGATGGTVGTGGTGGGTPAAGSQGTVSSPVIISGGGSTSGSVSVNGPSYYEITGLTGGATYSVTFANISTGILPVLYSSNTNTNPQSCFYSAVSGTASCIVPASPTGTIFIMVSDFSTTSATYSISAALAVNAGQGLPTAPVAVALGSTYSGSLTSGVSTTTYDSGNSGYYSLTGLTPNHKYSISLTASAGTAGLHAYQSSYSSEATVGCSGGTGTYCTITAGGTSLLLQVRALDTATFTITSADLGAATTFTSQGTVGSEVALKLAEPDDTMPATLTPNGSVNTGKSYYTVSRLVPGQRYDVFLNSLGDAVNLYVYTDAGYSKLACSSTYGTSYYFNTNNGDDCLATPTASGQLWIVADGATAQSYLGSTFFVGALLLPQSQGTTTAPVMVNSATDLPYRVNWTGGATSYYEITGLPANTTMMVTTRADYDWAADYGDVSTYPASGFSSGATCQTQGNPVNAYQSCTGTTDGSGNLYVSLDIGWFPNYQYGGTAYLSVKPLPVNDGTATAPLAESMTSTPSFTGKVSGPTGYSYYALTGLAASTKYYIRASFGTDGQSGALAVFNTFTGNLSTQTATCNAAESYLNDGCTATSDASGNLWVQVGGWTTDNGTSYTIDALPVPVNQGTQAAPLDITTQLPYRGTLASSAGTSYYMITGLTAGTEYFFSDADSSAGETIWVYNDAAFTSQVCSTYAMSGRRTNDCRGVSTSGTAYIMVSGSWKGYFTLGMSPVPAADGTAAAPVAYTSAGSLLSGKVNVGASYYEATLSPNTLYTISLNSVVGDPDLQVFNNAAMTGSAACHSIKGANVTESCQASSDANGHLWITVNGELSRTGGTYQLKAN